MAEEKDLQAMEDEEVIVEMTDDEGNTAYYAQEMIIAVGDDKFALLVPTVADDDCACGCDHEHEHHDHDHDGDCDCGCGCEDGEEAFFAKIVVDENGEEIYVDPTDEEFEAVCAAYDDLVASEEE